MPGARIWMIVVRYLTEPIIEEMPTHVSPISQSVCPMWLPGADSGLTVSVA